MQILVRLPIAAVTAGVVGASAMVMTPVFATATRVVDNTAVALAAFVNPIAVLGETLQDFNRFTFSTEFPSGPADPLYYVVGNTQAGVVPQLLNGGIVPVSPQTPDDGRFYYGTPALNSIGNNWSEYGYAALTGFNALTGGIGGFAVLTDALTYIATNLFQNAVTTATRVLAGITEFGSLAAGQLVYLAGKAIEVGSDVIGALPDVEAAWNVAIEGTLGPSGLLGDLVNLTQGFGILGAAEPTEDNPVGLLPSWRTASTVFTREWSDSIFNVPFSPSEVLVTEEVHFAATEDATPVASAAAADASAAADDSRAVADDASVGADDARVVADDVSTPDVTAGVTSRDDRVAAESPEPRVLRRAGDGGPRGDSGSGRITESSDRAVRGESAA